MLPVTFDLLQSNRDAEIEPPPPDATNPALERKGPDDVPVASEVQATGATVASQLTFVTGGMTTGPDAFVQTPGNATGTPRGDRESKPPPLPHVGDDAGNRGRTSNRGSNGADNPTKRNQC